MLILNLDCSRIVLTFFVLQLQPRTGETQTTSMPSKDKLNRLFSINGQDVVTGQPPCVDIQKAKIDKDPMILAQQLLTQFTDLDTEEINTILQDHVPDDINKSCNTFETHFLPYLEKAAAEEREQISQNEDHVGDAIEGIKSPAFYKKLDEYLNEIIEVPLNLKPIFKNLKYVIDDTINPITIDRNIFHKNWSNFIHSILVMATLNVNTEKFAYGEASVRSVYNHNCIPHIYYNIP